MQRLTTVLHARIRNTSQCRMFPERLLPTLIRTSQPVLQHYLAHGGECQSVFGLPRRDEPLFVRPLHELHRDDQLSNEQQPWFWTMRR